MATAHESRLLAGTSLPARSRHLRALSGRRACSFLRSEAIAGNTPPKTTCPLGSHSHQPKNPVGCGPHRSRCRRRRRVRPCQYPHSLPDLSPEANYRTSTEAKSADGHGNTALRLPKLSNISPPDISAATSRPKTCATLRRNVAHLSVQDAGRMHSRPPVLVPGRAALASGTLSASYSFRLQPRWHKRRFGTGYSARAAQQAIPNPHGINHSDPHQDQEHAAHSGI
jgi:hypothetical protein